MLRLNEQQIDRVIHNHRLHLFVGLSIMSLVIVLPRGWAFGLFSGFMLFALGIYGFALRKWRTEPGVWMLAVFLTVTLSPCWLHFEFLHWQGFLAQQAGRPINFQQLSFSIDAMVSLFLFAHTVKFTLAVAIENWNRTRITQPTTKLLPKKTNTEDQ